MEARIDYSKGARTKLSLISQRLTRTIIGYSDCNSLGVGEDYFDGDFFFLRNICLLFVCFNAQFSIYILRAGFNLC